MVRYPPVKSFWSSAAINSRESLRAVVPGTSRRSGGMRDNTAVEGGAVRQQAARARLYQRDQELAMGRFHWRESALYSGKQSSKLEELCESADRITTLH